MIFLERKALNYAVDSEGRTTLLQELYEQNLNPLIRSTRHHCFQTVLGDSDRTGEMEAAIASWTEKANSQPFIPGDIFCFSDHVLFLVFEDEDQGEPMIGAGIIFNAKTPEPFRKLDSFCSIRSEERRVGKECK